MADIKALCVAVGEGERDLAPLPATADELGERTAAANPAIERLRTAEGPAPPHRVSLSRPVHADHLDAAAGCGIDGHIVDEETRHATRAR